MKYGSPLKVVLVMVTAVLLGRSAMAQTTCSADTDCTEAFTECNSASNECVTKSLLNVSAGDVVGSVLVLLGAMLAAGGGLGGGGIFIPILVLVVGMSAKQAIPISQVTIFGGSIVNMTFNVPRKHPLIPGRPLIDYMAILMFTPCLLAGTFTGVILNQLFPSWAITAMLVVTLVYASVRTIKKALLSWAKETAKKSEFKQEEDESIELSEKAIAQSQVRNAKGKELCDASVLDSVAQADAAKHENPDKSSEKMELQRLMAADNVVMKPVAIVVAILLFGTLVSLLRGGKSGSLSVIGIMACSWEFWLITALYPLILFGISFALALWMSARTDRKLALGWKPQNSEVVWSRKNALLYPIFSTLAGMLGGLLGIGGGMILGPLLLEIHLDNQATAATAATAVFLTSLSAALQFLILNFLIADYAIWFFVVGMIATICGQTGVNYLVRRTGRTSFIVASIAGVVTFATVMMTIAGVVSVIQDINEDRSLGISSLC